jgi:hypothetical protein
MLLVLIAFNAPAITIYNIRCQDDCGVVKDVDAIGIHYVKCSGKRDIKCPVRLGITSGQIIDLSGQIANTTMK